MNSQSPPILRSLIKKITPPKGVKRKIPEINDKPEDGGTDCEEDEISMADLNEEVEDELPDQEPAVSMDGHNASTSNASPVMFTAPVLEDLCPDKPEHKHDAEFLDKFQELLDHYDGKLSTQFNSDLMRFKQVNTNARHAFKARFR